MGYKNPISLLVDATKLPAAIEAKLPAGAPAISTMLADAASKLPAVPDFPVEIPDLPAPPELPEAPAALRRVVTGVEVTQARREGAAPAARPQSEIVPLVFE